MARTIPMMLATTTLTTLQPPCSELVLSDRLIALAEDAGRAGFIDTAERLITLACSVFDEAPKVHH
jgi:hypothetical protein